MAEDTEAAALLEWIGSVEACSKRYQSVEELADGEALLRIMHDLSPDGFPLPDGRRGRYLLHLLEGLEEHLQGRGESDHTCEHLLRQAKAGNPVDAALLAKLVLVATVENDLPRRIYYVEAMMNLSHETQEALRHCLQRFQIGAGLESPTPAMTPHARAPFHTESAFTPEASPPMGRMVSHSTVSEHMPDFREAGLEQDERFRRLQDQYNVAMDAQERLLEETATLKRDLEAEQEKRRKAEQAERTMRVDLREAEEARDRAREEQRASFEQRLKAEVGESRARFAQKDEELEAIREELGLARGQAASAERLQNQLELFKQKLEESQAFRLENIELRNQIDELLNKGDNVAGEHLHRSLARARESASKAAMERDEFQRQNELLREELSREQESVRKHREGVAAVQHSCSGAEGGVAGQPPNRHSVALEASAAILAAAAMDREQPGHARSSNVGTSEGGSASAEELQELRLLRAQKEAQQREKEEMLERLLVEKERATRVETTLQAKTAEFASLSEQKTSLTKQVTLLEDALKSRSDSAGAQLVQQESVEGAKDSAKFQELQSKLAMQEKELQVYQWRKKADDDTLTAQEGLMASCFHELGLRYQRLKLENDQLRQRVHGQLGTT